MKKYILLLMPFISFGQEEQYKKINDSIKTTFLDEILFSVPFHGKQSENIIRVDKIDLNDYRNNGQVNISDVLDDVPGLSFLKVGAHISKPVIRGLSTNRVVTYTNGIRYENQQWGYEHSLGLSQSGISSVEIIKGPSSLLYGSDAIGGVIYVNPEKYLKNKNFSTDYTSYYNSNTNGLSNNLGIRWSSNKLNFLIRGNMVNHDDFKSGEETIENSGMTDRDLKFGLGFNNVNLNTDLRIQNTYSNFDLPFSHEDEDHEDEDHEDEDHEEESPHQETNTTIISLKNEFFIGENSSINLGIGYNRHNRLEHGHHDEDHDDEDEEASLDMLLESKTIDYRYNWLNNDNAEIVLGGQYIFQKNKNYGHETLIPDSKKIDLGFYFTSHLHFNDLDLLLGMRTDSRNIEVNNEKYNFSSLVGSTGIKYDKNNSNFRLNFSSGYRAPNLSELFSDGVHHGTSQYELGNINLTEEKNFQVDFSYELIKSDLRFGFDLFYNKVNDYIFLSPTGNFIDEYPSFEYLQSDAKLYGGEIYLQVVPEKLKWFESFTTIDYVKGDQLDGENLPLIPPLSLKQKFKFDKGKNSFFFDINAVANQEKVSYFESKTDGYILFDIGYQYKLSLFKKDLKLNINLENLFNKSYYNHLSRLKNLGIMEMGRSISIGINYVI